MNIEIRVWLERQTPAMVERFNERAAIMEHDGGLSRDEAEQAAFEEMRKR